MKNFLKKSVLFLVFIAVLTITACSFGGVGGVRRAERDVQHGAYQNTEVF